MTPAVCNCWGFFVEIILNFISENNFSILGVKSYEQVMISERSAPILPRFSFLKITFTLC